MRLLPILLCLLATLAFSQVITTSILDGTVTDSQGGVAVLAQVIVTNADNGQTFRTATDERGHWVFPSMPAGTYRVSVTLTGFRTTTIEAVKIDAGVPATVNVKLEVGQVTERVDVAAGAELVQTTSATVNTTLQGRQISELPFTSRNALELLVSQAGTQTGSTARNSFINGLPFAAINITTDGINTQDNFYKSGDGFFTLIPVRPDSLEEVTLETSAATAASLAQGAAQVKFITRGGTNTFHGSAFWQHRNTALDANYYFNNINGLPRDRIILNQGGINVGGPLRRNKLFFFTNFEISRNPATSSATRTVLNPAAIDGNFTYLDSSRKLNTVNLYNLAAANRFPSTPDPIMLKTFQQINALTTNGVLRPRTATSNDYNRSDLSFQPGGLNKSSYSTTRLDYNLTERHQLQVVYTYFVTNSTPDITNSVVPIYPGTGTVLGQDSLIAGQRGNRYAGVVALRSILTPRLTNEFRGGMNRSITMFRDQVSSPTLFSQWRGYSLGSTMGSANGASYLTGVASVSGSSRRTSPVKEVHDNMSWVKGAHLFAFGGSFSQIDFWQQTINNNTIPTIAFAGAATNDPINTGSTGIFTVQNFPGATQTQLNEAVALYALLTGRVTSVGRSVALDGNTHQYANVPAIDLNRQREWGWYAQDTWKLRRDLTLSAGLRYENQRPFENRDDTYSAVSLAGIWGISGIGHMFEPGMQTGVHPQFTPVGAPYATPATWNPSVGLAWQLPWKSVLRAGYSIATVREGTYTYFNIYGSNVGRSVGNSVDPGNYPQYFGAAGSVLFRDPTLPSRPAPLKPDYPIAALQTDSLNAFDPNLKMGYVQSWNLGFQRELPGNAVMEIRYTGNHGVHEWRQVNLNEVNVFENGFLNEFYIAQNNLRITQRTTPTSTNYGNQGLPGQQNIPIIQTALATVTDSTTATYLRQNRAGNLAGSIFNNSTRMSRLTAARYPANMFVVNPDVASGGAYLMTNLGSSFYDAMQVEVKKRMSAGLTFQASYVWAHSIINGASSDLADYNTPTTFRNLRLDRAPAGFDIRHAIKANWIYELPFGRGRTYLNSGNAVLGKLVEGWQIAGISRIQSGTPFQLTSGRGGMNTADNGVVLYNMTAADLQDLMQISKVTGADRKGQVFYLPQSLIDNTNAAFEVNGKTPANLDPTKPYIGTQQGAQFGYRVYLRNPRQYRLDLSAVKRTTIRERANVEFRANFLDALNMTNFFIANAPSSALFGQTSTAFRDFSGSSDPGSRIIEFQLRVNF
jgi:Carboxypeptidase regulatory-like domain